MRFRAPALPTAETLSKVLQSCVAEQTQRFRLRPLHAKSLVSGLGTDVFFNNLLIDGYRKSTHIFEARKLFDKMPQRNIVSWSSVISMYTQNGRSEEALSLFSLFWRSSFDRANDFVFAGVLSACVQSNGVWRALQVHGLVLKMGYDSDLYVGTALINFYSNVGWMAEAMAIFNGLPEVNSVAWTAVITGYTHIGKSEVSLWLFKLMLEEERIEPDRFLLSSILSACTANEFFDRGRQIHGFMYRSGIDLDISVNNVLIDLYCKCSRVKTARKIFDLMSSKNLVSWTSMIAGYMQNSFDEEAMDLFYKMGRSGFIPDAFACTSVFSSCSSLAGLLQGKQVHGYVVKANLESDEFVINGLIDMYAKCDSLDDARAVFDVMDEKNVISYNTMIEGYSKHEKMDEALDLFREMKRGFLQPSPLTYISLLGVSARLSVIEISRQVHANIIKSSVSVDIFAGCALVDVYSKCSCVRDARKVFESMNYKDLVVWNAMIFGYTQNGEGEEAIKLFQQLLQNGTRPCDFTFVAVITATSNLSSVSHGSQFHSQVIRQGLDFDPHISNALIDMYSKCGFIEEAWILFKSDLSRDIVHWNSIILTFAQHGHAEEAVRVFWSMRMDGIEPNYVTFVGLLSACSHVGLVSEGMGHFYSMEENFGIKPGMEHYTSVVSLLGRSGRLQEAKEFIEKMPISPAATVWRSLLSSCRACGNVDIGEYAARMAIASDPAQSGPYVLFSSILASKGRWVDAERVRKEMGRSGAAKETGFSWIEVAGVVHVFVSKGREQRQGNSVYQVLDDLRRVSTEHLPLR